MVSIVYKKRTLPLMWDTRKGGKELFQKHIEIIKAAHELIPM